jgi:hypothetical protein
VAEVPSAQQKSGLTRGKAITIGILAVVLVVVLYLQFGSAGSESAADPVGYTPRRQVSTATAVPPQQQAAEKKSQTASGANVDVTAVVDLARWKSPNLADVVDYDPFALPKAFPQPRLVGTDATKAEGLIAAAAEDDKQKLADVLAQQQMQWQELKQRGVHVIVREHDEYVAVIGDQTVHVGDEVLGYTVTGIDSQGVHVERKATQ